MSNYSIYIPRVFNNISNQKIINAFEQYELGKISSIDVKYKTGVDEICYKVVFIHFSHWNEHNRSAINLRDRIENPEKEARLIYDDPWYWILLPNTSVWTQENTCQSQMSIETCYEKISRMEHEFTKIYKELLHNNRYVPVNYSIESSNQIESCSSVYHSETLSNVSPMTIDELLTVDIEQNQYDGELHKPPTPPVNNNLSKTSCDYDYEYESDFELDLDSGCSGVDYESSSSIQSKHWMTVNFCGND
tara:strand:- start:107 stop:850 length:744 start_codon:yes stop_codon:yes gene_type:complete